MKTIRIILCALMIIVLVTGCGGGGGDGDGDGDNEYSLQSYLVSSKSSIKDWNLYTYNGSNVPVISANIG